MPRSPFRADDLWTMPRVGPAEPSPDGSRLVVPVTEHSIEDNRGTTRLWLLPADGSGGGRGGADDPARPLTGADRSASQPRWSPDGRELLFVRTPGGEPPEGSGPRHPDRPQLWRLRLDGGEPERLTDLPHGVADPHWLGDTGRVVFLAGMHLDDPTPDGTARLAKEQADDPVQAETTEDRFFRMWDGWMTGRVRRHVCVLDLATRELLNLTPRFDGWTRPTEEQGHLAASPDGTRVVLAATTSRPPHDPLLWGLHLVKVPARIRANARVGNPHRLGPRGPADLSGPLWSPDGRFVLHGISPDTTLWADRERLAVHDVERDEHTVLTEAWPLSATGWCWGADGRTVHATADVEGRGALFALPFRGGARRARGVPGEIARGGTWAAPRAAGGRVFALRSGLLAPPEVVSVAADGGDARHESAFTARAMARVRLGRVEEAVFEGADGDPVQMWLVHPPRGARKRAAGRERPPLLHLIHGGPHGSFGDTWHWRWNAHVFAARGYLCALVNFHGSTGWGQPFAESIVGEWGDKPARDIEAATDWLIAKGKCDPERLAAAGGSYGGYLASWIASRTGRYRCIVNHAGVCDMQTQWGSDIPQGWHRSAGGDLWSDRDGLDRWNPLRHAEGFSSPMLILHGERDYRVPYYQALQLYNVYKARGLEARLVVYPHENHWILKPKASLHWYGEFLAWLDRHLGA